MGNNEEYENMTQTKGEINRLGDKIRTEINSLSDETLKELQEYRISHKETLSAVFSILITYARKIHPSTIVTYRIKRFESIIGKLVRYDKMQLSRMWDIGGCRCIVKNDDYVYKLRDLLKTDENIDIVKSYDYIANPQDDGYKSLHLFIKHKEFDKTIEVQIRSFEEHNWATLVEITDVIFGSKIKEYGDNEELGHFHYLLSKFEDLDLNEKKEIANIIKKHNYFEKLSNTFSRNHLKVRVQWYDIVEKQKCNYFLIETKKNEIPKIKAYSDSESAEEDYFNIYKNSENANIVLTHLQNTSYSQISTAYSNYILTYHSFVDEVFVILENIIEEAFQSGKYKDIYRFYNDYNSFTLTHLKNIISEIKELAKYAIENQKCDRKTRKKKKKKENEWIKDIEKERDKRQSSAKRLSVKLRNAIPQKSIRFYITIRILKHIEKRYRKKINILLKDN